MWDTLEGWIEICRGEQRGRDTGEISQGSEKGENGLQQRRSPPSPGPARWVAQEVIRKDCCYMLLSVAPNGRADKV